MSRPSLVTPTKSADLPCRRRTLVSLMFFLSIAPACGSAAPRCHDGAVESDAMPDVSSDMATYGFDAAHATEVGGGDETDSSGTGGAPGKGGTSGTGGAPGTGGTGGAGGSSCSPIPDGMVAWWPGDGNSDDILGGTPGVLQGAVTFASGQVRQAFSLNGSNSWVDLGNAPKVRVSAADFSVEAWVLFNSHQGDMSVVDKMSAGGVNADGWRLIKQADDRFWFCFGGGTQNRCTPLDTAFTVYSTTHVVPGVWFHVAAVKSNVGFALYVNGVREDSRSAVPSFVDTDSADLRLGFSVEQGASANLDGLIDEVKLFNRALTDAEVRQSYISAGIGECRGGAGGAGGVGAGGTGGVDAAASATMFVPNNASNVVYRYTITPDRAPALTTSIPVSLAHGVAMRGNGELFVNEYSAAGTLSRFLSPLGTPVANGMVSNVGIHYPQGFVFVDDELWVLNSEAYACSTQPEDLIRLAFDAQGTASVVGTVQADLVGANRGLLWVPATRDLYVSQCVGVDTIQHYRVALDHTTTLLPAITGNGLNNPHGMVMTAWGELLVANLFANEILRFRVDDQGTANLNGRIVANGLNLPVSLALAPWGELFVANLGDGTVSRFTFDSSHVAAGNGTFSTGSPAAGPDGLGWLTIVP